MERCSTEVQVKEEPTPETLLQNLQPSLIEDHASIVPTPAPCQSNTRPASSPCEAMQKSLVGTESIEDALVALDSRNNLGGFGF